MAIEFVRQALQSWTENGPHGQDKITHCRSYIRNQPRVKIFLVGGLEHVLFFHILGTIIPFDKYFSEGLKPPSSFVQQLAKDSMKQE
jgi:hypothetical protein